MSECEHVLYSGSSDAHVRVQNLTVFRLISHVVTGLLLGVLYFNIGRHADLMRSNASSLFFHAMLMMFAAMIPTIQTCAPRPSRRPLHAPSTATPTAFHLLSTRSTLYEFTRTRTTAQHPPNA